MGWTATVIPEEYEDWDIYLELCVIAEELGEALLPFPFYLLFTCD